MQSSAGLARPSLRARPQRMYLRERVRSCLRNDAWKCKTRIHQAFNGYDVIFRQHCPFHVCVVSYPMGTVSVVDEEMCR